MLGHNLNHSDPRPPGGQPGEVGGSITVSTGDITRPPMTRFTPSVQNDVYLLNCFHDRNLKHFYEFAFIPDYNTSVMMNKLFRIIKENDNLDLLEESDDEDEFQNVDLDKFVHLDKCIPMVCSFNYRFKKWVPIKVSNSNKICNLYTLHNFVKNNYVLPPTKHNS